MSANCICDCQSCKDKQTPNERYRLNQPYPLRRNFGGRRASFQSPLRGGGSSGRANVKRDAVDGLRDDDEKDNSTIAFSFKIVQEGKRQKKG